MLHQYVLRVFGFGGQEGGGGGGFREHELIA